MQGMFKDIDEFKNEVKTAGKEVMPRFFDKLTDNPMTLDGNRENIAFRGTGEADKDKLQEKAEDLKKIQKLDEDIKYHDTRARRGDIADTDRIDHANAAAEAGQEKKKLEDKWRYG